MSLDPHYDERQRNAAAATAGNLECVVVQPQRCLFRLYDRDEPDPADRHRPKYAAGRGV